MTTDLHKRLEEAAERFALEKCKRKHIDETYSIYPTFFRLCKEDYFEMAEDVWKESIKVAEEWLKSSFFQCLGEDDNIHWDSSYDDITEALESFESEMLKLWEEKK